MTGPKLNEGQLHAGDPIGTRAKARYIRSSAYKAREVLDLIRGLDVKAADELLQFSERDIAIVIRKVLASAVANAQNNDGQDPEELYVSACYSDEGPTLKRFRPRARGRAGAIRKRTCHITVVVDRLSDSALSRKRAKEDAAPAGRPRTGAQATQRSRRERVARSRAQAAPADHDHDHDDDGDHGDEAEASVALAATETEAVETEAVETEAVETEAVETATESVIEPFGPGSASPLADGSAPEGFEIKGNAQSMLYHVPGSRYYQATKAEVWFDSTVAAIAAGFSAPGQSGADDAEASTTEEAE